MNHQIESGSLRWLDFCRRGKANKKKGEIWKSKGRIVSWTGETYLSLLFMIMKDKDKWYLPTGQTRRIVEQKY